MAHIINSDGSQEDDTTKASKEFADRIRAHTPIGRHENIRQTSRQRGEPTTQAGINEPPKRQGLGMGEQPSTMPNVAATDPRLTPGNMANPTTNTDLPAMGHVTMAPASWHWFARNVEDQAAKLRPSGLDLDNKDDESNRAR